MITGAILRHNGWEQGKAIGLAKHIGIQLENGGDTQEVALEKLALVKANPQEYISHALYGELAKELLPPVEPDNQAVVLRDLPDYPKWGVEKTEAYPEGMIDQSAIDQMNTSMRLPISRAGALMPDSHWGYGLPIGGVLGTENAVIPFGVGVDIACRMRLSIFPQSPIVLGQERGRFEKAIRENTFFGMGVQGKVREDVFMDTEDWRNLPPLLRRLKDKAFNQIGTSGGGNHFVEFGELEITDEYDEVGLRKGTYLALLSHSGSRGFGKSIADFYTKIAMELHPKLPKEAKYLAWLDLGTEPGEEYWLAMQVAGRYAAANHRIIHHAVAKASGLKEILVIENHHNFAWKEMHLVGNERKEMIVHRKGATPAGDGVLGIIPGSMGDPGYVVLGKNNEASLSSASHGAGRRMGREAAKKVFTKTQQDAYLAERGIIMLGGGVDESPAAYKDIDDVMAAQTDLVQIVGKFTNRIGRMADDGSSED